MEQMTQTAPYPVELGELVESLKYHQQGWEFSLGHADRDTDLKTGEVIGAGLTLSIRITCDDAYHEGRLRSVVHYFVVPAATYDRRSWRRWLFERIRDVHTHEAMENFEVDGERPFAPSHGPGNDPYMVRELGTELDRRTSFRGEVNPT